MSALQAVRQVLIADGTITALVPAKDVYVMRALDGMGDPFVTLSVISKMDHARDMTGDSGYRKRRIQVSVFSRLYETLDSLSKAIKHALLAYSGVSGGYQIYSFTDVGGRTVEVPADEIFRDDTDYHMEYKES